MSEAELGLPTGLEMARELAEIGPGVAVHLRARIASSSLFECARDLSARAWVSGGWCVVNGRPDIALAASARAVQLGRTALDVRDTRRVLGAESDVRIGVSVHSAGGAREAVANGADYLIGGTAYVTPTHPGVKGCGPVGISAICEAARGVGVFAIGGVTGDRVGEMIEAGAAGVAVSRAVWGADDPVASARVLSDLVADARARMDR